MKNVTLRQLRIFEAVARHLSFSRAATELHLTQPAVSMQVHALEELAGLPLVEHIGKRVRLTTAGEELCGHARRVAQVIDEAGEAMRALRQPGRGRLAIGAVSTAKYLAPQLMAAFRRRFPDIELRLSVHNRAEIVRQLTDNEIDLAIMGTPPAQLDTVAEPFADHPLVIIAPPDHPLARRRRLAPGDLASCPFLIREPGSGTRAAMERFFGEHAVTLRESVEMASNETIKQAVMAGLGLGFISAHAIALELAAGRLVILPVSGTPVMRQWYAVRRRDKRLLPAAQSFQRFMSEEAAAVVAVLGGTPAPGRRSRVRTSAT